MLRVVSKYSTVVACDVPGCPSLFVSGSFRSLARLQSRILAWQRVPPWAIGVEDSPRRRLDACPSHAIKANAAIQERAEQREQKRAEKARRKMERLQRALSLAESAPPEVPADLPAPRIRRPRRPPDTPSNLDVIERILRDHGTAMTVPEIVASAIGDLVLPTRSKTPRTVVSRDLALDVRDHENSRFERVARGLFALRKPLESLKEET